MKKHFILFAILALLFLAPSVCFANEDTYFICVGTAAGKRKVKNQDPEYKMFSDSGFGIGFVTVMGDKKKPFTIGYACCINALTNINIFNDKEENKFYYFDLSATVLGLGVKANLWKGAALALYSGLGGSLSLGHNFISFGVGAGGFIRQNIAENALNIVLGADIMAFPYAFATKQNDRSQVIGYLGVQVL